MVYHVFLPLFDPFCPMYSLFSLAILVLELISHDTHVCRQNTQPEFYSTWLVQKSKHVNGKVVKTTIANLTKLPQEVILGIRILLKGGTAVKSIRDFRTDTSELSTMETGTLTSSADSFPFGSSG